VTCGGAPVYLWPGGGITLMIDVTTMPDNAFGYVPTPAIVAPIEFTLRREDYAALGGHMERIVTLAEVVASMRVQTIAAPSDQPWPLHGMGPATCIDIIPSHQASLHSASPHPHLPPESGRKPG